MYRRRHQLFLLVLFHTFNGGINLIVHHGGGDSGGGCLLGPFGTWYVIRPFHIAIYILAVVCVVVLTISIIIINNIIITIRCLLRLSITTAATASWYLTSPVNELIVTIV